MTRETPAPLRALIYARESKYEARAGNRSPEEQVEVAREWCDDHGHPVVEVIVESGISASRHGRKARPGWQRAKGLIAGRDVDILVTWASSRATRQLGEYVELRDLCATHGVLWCRKSQVLDLSRADHRLLSGIEAVVDDHAVEVLRDDIHRTLRANARRGRPQGRTLYGYRRLYDGETRRLLRQEAHPGQAWVVRDIFALYLAGHSTNAIADGLTVANALGLVFGPGTPTSTGLGAWAGGTVRRILTNPAYKGRRVYNGADIAEGIWPALVDVDTFDRVQRRLEHRSVKRNRTGPQPHLLTGVAVCAVCHGRLTHMPAWRNRQAFYYCRGRGRHVARMAHLLEDWVTVAVLERLGRPDIADVLSGDEPPAVVAARAELAGLRAEMDEALARFRGEVEPRLSVQGFAAVEAHLLPRIDAAEAKMRSARVPLGIEVPPAGRVGGWWDGLSAVQRREVVAALVVEVVVSPVGKGARGYAWDEVTRIEWRR